MTPRNRFRQEPVDLLCNDKGRIVCMPIMIVIRVGFISKLLLPRLRVQVINNPINTCRENHQTFRLSRMMNFKCNNQRSWFFNGGFQILSEICCTRYRRSNGQLKNGLVQIFEFLFSGKCVTNENLQNASKCASLKLLRH
jgi:hypothetical protein